MKLSIEGTPLLTISPDILGGTPVFRGTRVPIAALLRNLEAGVSIEEFLENFPTVSREQVLVVIKHTHACEPLEDLTTIAQIKFG